MKITTTKTERTARQASKYTRNQIAALLNKITLKMDEYRDAEHWNRTTWGEVGNLQHTKAELEQIVRFLNNEEI